jgi:hypothetical protein
MFSLDIEDLIALNKKGLVGFVLILVKQSEAIKSKHGYSQVAWALF